MFRLKITIAFLALITVLFLYGPLLSWAAGPITASDKLQKVDAIVILSGGLNGDGSPGSSTVERMDYGLKLFQEDYAPKIILSGGAAKNNKKEASVMYDYALEKGFPPDVFLLEQSSTNTEENVNFTKALLAEKAYKKIIMVTSPYQTARAKQEFLDQGVNVISAPVTDSELYKNEPKVKFHMARIIAEEYVSYGLYRIKSALSLVGK